MVEFLKVVVAEPVVVQETFYVLWFFQVLKIFVEFQFFLILMMVCQNFIVPARLTLEVLAFSFQLIVYLSIF